MSLTKFKKQSGFTIIELLIVIVIIGILATIVIVNFTNAQRNARNSQRKSDIGILATQLQAYYAQNSSYPADAQMVSSTVAKPIGIEADSEAFKDPLDSDSNLLTGTATPTANTYTYQATPTGCTTAARDCIGFTLTALYEGTYEGATNIVKTGP